MRLVLTFYFALATLSLVAQTKISALDMLTSRPAPISQRLLAFDANGLPSLVDPASLSTVQTWDQTLRQGHSTTTTPTIIAKSFRGTDILALDQNWGRGLVIAGTSENGSGAGFNTGALAFTKPNNLVAVRSAITGFQQGSDNDVQGLAFWTYPSPISSEPLTRAMVLNSDGTLFIPGYAGSTTRYLGTLPNGSLVSMPYPYSPSNPQVVSLSGDVTGASSTTTVEKIRGLELPTIAPFQGSTLRWNSFTSSFDWATLPISFEDLAGTVAPAQLATGAPDAGRVLVSTGPTTPAEWRVSVGAAPEIRAVVTSDVTIDAPYSGIKLILSVPIPPNSSWYAYEAVIYYRPGPGGIAVSLDGPLERKIVVGQDPTNVYASNQFRDATNTSGSKVGRVYGVVRNTTVAILDFEMNAFKNSNASGNTILEAGSHIRFTKLN